MGKSEGCGDGNEWGCEDGEDGVLKLSEGLWKVYGRCGDIDECKGGKVIVGFKGIV